MKYIYYTFFYTPLLNLLVLIYHIIPDLGVSIIILTLLIRFLLLPLFYKSAKDQTIIQQHVAPKVKEIKEKYKNDKEKQVQEMMAAYKEHKVSPFSGFALILIQLPVLIALYRVFLNDFTKSLSEHLYSFVPAIDSIHTMFLGVVDLTQKNIWIVLLAVLFQYLQSKLMFNINRNRKDNSKQDKQGAIMEKATKGMVIIGPLFTLLILSNFPSAVALYWMTTSVFSTVQQIIINKQLDKKQHAGSSEKTRTDDNPNGV